MIKWKVGVEILKNSDFQEIALKTRKKNDGYNKSK